MSNTFTNTSLVARDASIILADNLVAYSLCNTDHENKFADSVGSSISLKVPPQGVVARDFIDDGSTTDTNIVETNVSLELTEQPYVARTLTTSDLSLKLDDFNTVITQPSALAIRDAIDSFCISSGARGYARNVAGTAGTSPSSLAHLAAGVKILNDNGCPLSNRVGLLSTTAQASLMQLEQFTSGLYGAGKAQGLAEGQMTRLYGVNWAVDQNVGTHSRGDVGDATHLDGATVTGATSIAIDDNAGGSTGTIYKGSRFIVTGDTATLFYTVTADTAASGGSFTLPVTPVVNATTTALGNGVAVTWDTARTENIIYKKESLVAAVVAPRPLAVGSSVAFFDGIGIRVTSSTSTSSLSDQIVLDTFLGANVLEPDAGVVLAGS